MKMKIVFAGLTHDYNVFKIGLLVHAWLPQSTLHQPSPSPSFPSSLPSPITTSPPKLPFLSSHYSASCRWCYDGQPDGYVAYKLPRVATNWVWSRVCSFLSCYYIFFQLHLHHRVEAVLRFKKKKRGLSDVSELVSDKICSFLCVSSKAVDGLSMSDVGICCSLDDG